MFKMYTKLLFLVLLLGATAHTVNAQRNFQPGYIVRTGGDTLRGEVDVRGAQRMAHLCLFRPSTGVEATSYTPADLKAYGLRKGTQYEAGQLPPAAAPGATPPTTAAVLFLQVLARGKAMLYTLTGDDGQVRYYFQQGGAPLAELIQTTQTVQNNSLLVQERVFPFRQVLSQAFSDCAAVQNMLVKAELKDSQLTAIFTRYNTCGPGQPALAAVPVRVTKAHFSLIAGVQTATTTLDDDGEVPLSSGLRPVVGVGLLVNPASFNSKLALRFEALYQTQLLEGEYQRKHGVVADLNSSRKAAISLKTVRVPLMLRYTVLPVGKLRPYVQVGGEVALLLDQHQALIIESNEELNGGHSTTTRQIGVRGTGIGPTASLGMLITTKAAGTVQLEGRINQLDSTSEVYKLLSGATTISFLLSYNLGH